MLSFVMFTSGSVVLLCGLLLERAGFFLYARYAVTTIGGFVLAGSLLVWAIMLFRSNRLGPAVMGVVVATVLIVTSRTVRGFDSSPRKKFYLLATEIKSGDSMQEISKTMQQYRSWSAGPGHVSFQFASGSGTAEVVIVNFNPQTGVVKDATLSLD